MMESASDIDRARSALWALDAGVDRHQWFRIGCAAKAAGLSFECKIARNNDPLRGGFRVQS